MQVGNRWSHLLLSVNVHRHLIHLIVNLPPFSHIPHTKKAQEQTNYGVQEPFFVLVSTPCDYWFVVSDLSSLLFFFFFFFFSIRWRRVGSYSNSSIGVSAMHMQLLKNNKVVIFDRMDMGPSNLSLPNGTACVTKPKLPNRLHCSLSLIRRRFKLVPSTPLPDRHVVLLRLFGLQRYLNPDRRIRRRGSSDTHFHSLRRRVL
jgi:hypothetical protein